MTKDLSLHSLILETDLLSRLFRQARRTKDLF